MARDAAGGLGGAGEDRSVNENTVLYDAISERHNVDAMGKVRGLFRARRLASLTETAKTLCDTLVPNVAAG